MVLEETIPAIGVHVSFFSGLSMLLPIIANAWDKHVIPWTYAPNGFFISIGLIVFAILLLGWIVGSFSGIIRKVGWMMILPGVLALIFAAAGTESVFSLARTQVSGFAILEPAARWAVEHAVPKAAYVGSIYLLGGVFLVWVGRRVQGLAERI